MTFCYTHKSVSCSAFIPEKFSPKADGNKYRDPQLDYMRSLRDRGSTALKRMSLSTPPLKTRALCKRESSKSVRAKEDRKKLQGNKASKPLRTDAHMNSQRLNSMHRACTICTSWSPRAERKSMHMPRP